MNTREGYGLGIKLMAGILLLTLCGCSTFRMGSICFLEYGIDGSCVIQKKAPVELRPE